MVEDKAAFRQREMRRLTGMVIVSAVLSLPFLLMMVLMFAAPHAHLTHLLHTGWWQLVVSTPVQFIIGWRFYKGAFLSLKNRSPNMDVLVALGTTAAWGYSTYNVLTGGTHLYFESAVIIITLILLGKLLETRARGKTSAAIEMLMNLQPKTATVLRDGREEVIAAADIRRTTGCWSTRVRVSLSTEWSRTAVPRWTNPCSRGKACLWRRKPARRCSAGRSTGQAL